MAAANPVVSLSVRMVALFLLIATLIFVTLIWFDDDVVRFARTAPKVVRTVFEFITLAGTSGWILVVTGAAGLALAAMDWKKLGRQTKVRAANLHADLTFTFFSIAVSGIAANLIKNTIGRARPKHLETLGHLEFDFSAFESSFASFPSGHSTTFGALCMVLMLLLPGQRWFWLILALLGGVSRVMVGAHYPADVMAGLLFGAGFTLLTGRWLAQRAVMFRFSGGAVLPVRKRFA